LKVLNLGNVVRVRVFIFITLYQRVEPKNNNLIESVVFSPKLISMTGWEQTFTVAFKGEQADYY